MMRTFYFVLGIVCAFIYLSCITSEPIKNISPKKIELSVASAQSISNNKLAKLRRNLTAEIAKTTSHRGYNKPQINKVFNALEDWYNINPGGYTGGGRSQMNSVVVDSSAITFTTSQKKLLIAFWLENKINEELGR